MANTDLRFRGLTLALALSFAALSPPALADKITVTVPQISPGELQNLQNRQQRQDYQNTQQINRELDSLAIRQNRPRLDIPVMKPSCVPKQPGGC